MFSFQMKDESLPTPSGATVAQKLVTADGTYATQSAFSSDVKTSGGKARKEKVTHCVHYVSILLKQFQEYLFRINLVKFGLNKSQITRRYDYTSCAIFFYSTSGVKRFPFIYFLRNVLLCASTWWKATSSWAHRWPPPSPSWPFATTLPSRTQSPRTPQEKWIASPPSPCSCSPRSSTSASPDFRPSRSPLTTPIASPFASRSWSIRPRPSTPSSRYNQRPVYCVINKRPAYFIGGIFVVSIFALIAELKKNQKLVLISLYYLLN